MKLLNTIQNIINEAEENLYNASLNSDDIKEIEILEKKVEESLNLLKILEDLS
jgi:hypothetical protein